MDLILFGVFLVLGLVLITLGLFRPEHMELSLIGFLLLFLLAIIILNNQITYKTGTFTLSNFSYTSENNLTLLTNSSESVVDIYTETTLGGYLSHVVGYYLALGAIIGFIGVIVAYRRRV